MFFLRCFCRDIYLYGVWFWNVLSWNCECVLNICFFVGRRVYGRCLGVICRIYFCFGVCFFGYFGFISVRVGSSSFGVLLKAIRRGWEMMKFSGVFRSCRK